MITDFFYQFFQDLWYTSAGSMHYGLDFLSQTISSLVCTLPLFLLLRPFVGKKVTTILYIALNIAFFCLQAYSMNGGIL